jgi:hypothetical protein
MRPGFIKRRTALHARDDPTDAGDSFAILAGWVNEKNEWIAHSPGE